MKWIVAIIAVEALVEIWLESELFDKPRIWMGAKSDFLSEFVTCGWCLSVWVAIPVFLLVYFGLWWLLIPLALHRASNYLHDINGLVRRSGRRKNANNE